MHSVPFAIILFQCNGVKQRSPSFAPGKLDGVYAFTMMLKLLIDVAQRLTWQIGTASVLRGQITIEPWTGTGGLGPMV